MIAGQIEMMAGARIHDDKKEKNPSKDRERIVKFIPTTIAALDFEFQSGNLIDVGFGQHFDIRLSVGRICATKPSYVGE
jgi:hypothetical protein